MLRHFIIVVVLFSQQLCADDYGNIQVSEIISVYDADTFRVNIRSWPGIIGINISIRVNGVDAAEIRGKCAYEKALAIKARDFTREKLENAEVVELRNLNRGKYFRILADVYVDDKSLAQQLISAGLARPYDGGKREPWCNFSEEKTGIWKKQSPAK